MNILELQNKLNKFKQHITQPLELYITEYLRTTGRYQLADQCGFFHNPPKVFYNSKHKTNFHEFEIYAIATGDLWEEINYEFFEFESENFCETVPVTKISLTSKQAELLYTNSFKVTNENSFQIINGLLYEYPIQQNEFYIEEKAIELLKNDIFKDIKLDDSKDALYVPDSQSELFMKIYDFQNYIPLFSYELEGGAYVKISLKCRDFRNNRSNYLFIFNERESIITFVDFDKFKEFVESSENIDDFINKFSDE